MDASNKRYQLGNYVKDWGHRVVRIVGIDYKNLSVNYGEDNHATLEWHDIFPIPIKANLLVQMGFSLLEEKRNPYHVKYSMSIVILGRHYNATGIEYDNKSLWSFSNTSILYVHQLQNILSIINPAMDCHMGPFPLQQNSSTKS